jgi:hypothetical protein
MCKIDTRNKFTPLKKVSFLILQSVMILQVSQSSFAGEAPVPVRSDAPASARAGLTRTESASLLREFTHAQGSEIKAMEHRFKIELSDMKTAQSLRAKEWKKAEQEARHRYFAENVKGPARRTYVHDFMARRDQFYKSQSEEKSRRVKEHEEQLSQIKLKHSENLKSFKLYLDKKEIPPKSLWPQAGS